MMAYGILDHLQSEEIPIALHLLTSYEVAGWLRPDEAAEWRCRLLALAEWYALDPEGPPN